MCSDACIVVALIYIERLERKTGRIWLNALSTHRYFKAACIRLVITALVLAIKLLEDKYYDNNYYAKVGGVSCRELNGMELRLVEELEYELQVTQEEYREYLNRQAIACVGNAEI
eukprot:TRINITY_DN6073_c0_g3_i8.p1 TRINITY_DN6073_c0_g3~~TRINITY_DN6073_c0_g3_i8.p1  ORF type:complete len:115 (-),score=11.15 TRINITY_DN6073_c0_g3_i8:205-549(-)